MAGREFFSSVENIFTGRESFGWSRMFFFLFRDNLIGECRGLPVSEITVTMTAIKIFKIKTSEKLQDVSRSFSSSKLHIRSKVTREKMKSDKNIYGNMEILCTLL